MSNDWLPGPRAEILAMCHNWISYMTAERRTAWGIPQDQFTELQGLCDAADALLQKAQDEAERTHVITVECQAAFAALSAKMRYFRDRFFKVPPLTEGDWAALSYPGGLPKSLRLFGLGVCGYAANSTNNVWSFGKAKTPPFRRGRRGHDGLRLLPLRKPEGGSGPVGACCFSHYTLTAETTWSLPAGRRGYLLRRCS
jgi:hypothetical protein